MNKKWIYCIIGGIGLAVTIFIILFFSIPRIDYNYDKELDCYYVNQAYGAAKSYKIEDEINGKKVLYINEKAFQDNYWLETIEMGKNIITIERLAFSNCEKLKTIDLSNVITIERNAFMECESLESVNLNSCVDLLGGAFYDCRLLKEVQLNVVKSIGTYAFTGTIIEEITLPETLELLGVDAFYSCNVLNKVYCYSDFLVENEYLLSLGSLVEFL